MTPPRTTPQGTTPQGTTPTVPAATSDATVVLTVSAAASISELLELCEQFLRTASPAVHAELQAFLTEEPQPEQPRRPDPACLIDLLGFHHLWLQAKATDADVAEAAPHHGGGR